MVVTQLACEAMEEARLSPGICEGPSGAECGALSVGVLLVRALLGAEVRTERLPPNGLASSTPGIAAPAPALPPPDMCGLWAAALLSVLPRPLPRAPPGVASVGPAVSGWRAGAGSDDRWRSAAHASAPMPVGQLRSRPAASRAPETSADMLYKLLSC